MEGVAVMIKIGRLGSLLGTAAALTIGSSAHAAYWNVFNIEGESSSSANILTFDTVTDMLNGTNYTGIYNPSAGGLFGRNVIDAGSNGSAYWLLFNIEGESGVSANILTFGSLTDMLNGTNHTGIYNPSAGGLFGRNVVGSGFDGSTYWLTFNIEGESSTSANILTFGSLTDMLNGTNYTGLYNPSTGGLFGRNVVDADSDGTNYWLTFNIEGESSVPASMLTFGSLTDMLNGTNYTGIYNPGSGGLFARNIVGSGSDSYVFAPTPDVPEPMAWTMLVAGLGVIGAMKKRAAFNTGRLS
jgi:hypothetical protein